MGKLIKETGSIMYEGVTRCAKCGSDLLEEGATRVLVASVGVDTYTHVFACSHCGNLISPKNTDGHGFHGS